MATIEGVPGGVINRTATMSAVVQAIDPATREVTLGDGAGNTRKVTAGPEVVNFDQIAVGDTVYVDYAEELVVYLPAEGEPDANGAAVVAARAPEGAKPAGLMGGSIEVTADVSAVDLEAHTATLKFPDGSEEVFPVRADVALDEGRIGQKVVLRATKAIAISVEGSGN